MAQRQGGPSSTTGAQEIARRPDQDDVAGQEVSPEAIAALVERVDELEEKLAKTRQTTVDMVRKVNDFEDRLDGGDDHGL